MNNDLVVSNFQTFCIQFCNCKCIINRIPFGGVGVKHDPSTWSFQPQPWNFMTFVFTFRNIFGPVFRGAAFAHPTYTAQKMKFSIKDFFSKWDQIWRFRRIWSRLLKKSLMENFIFCAVLKFGIIRSCHSSSTFKFRFNFEIISI